MAGLLALPNELKDLLRLSPQDLSRLSQTSRLIRQEFLPLLFKRISLHWEAKATAPPVSGLLKTILLSPQIAEMVQELHLREKGYPAYVEVPKNDGDAPSKRKTKTLKVEKPKVDNVTSETKNLLDEALHDMHMSGMLDKDVPDEHDELDIVITTILVHCPNLKVLHMGTVFLHQNTFLPKVLERLANIRPENEIYGHSALKKLENVSLIPNTPFDHGREWPEFPFSSYLPFFLSFVPEKRLWLFLRLRATLGPQQLSKRLAS
jgi:hypothetical protein